MLASPELVNLNSPAFRPPASASLRPIVPGVPPDCDDSPTLDDLVAAKTTVRALEILVRIAEIVMLLTPTDLVILSNTVGQFPAKNAILARLLLVPARTWTRSGFLDDKSFPWYLAFVWNAYQCPLKKDRSLKVLRKRLFSKVSSKVKNEQQNYFRKYFRIQHI